MNKNYSGPAEMPPEKVRLYMYNKEPVEYTQVLCEKRKGYSINRVSIPAITTSKC